MLGEIYLEDLLYFYFGMQLGIHLWAAINVHEQPCPCKNSLETHRIDC